MKGFERRGLRLLAVVCLMLLTFSTVGLTQGTRPSNATPGANERARQDAEQRYLQRLSGDATLMAPGTHTKAPTTIRVAMRNNENPLGGIDSVKEITFYASSGTNDYVQNVLPNEWYCSWPAESLKAGAMAIKMYGWYHTIYPKYPSSKADVDNTTNSQIYRAGSAHSSCTSATRAIANEGFRRSWQGVEPYVFQTAYCAGEYRDDKQLNCTNYGVGDALSQWGSKYFADQGWSYRTILNYYYNPPRNDIQEFFYY